MRFNKNIFYTKLIDTVRHVGRLPQGLLSARRFPPPPPLPCRSLDFWIWPQHDCSRETSLQNFHIEFIYIYIYRVLNIDENKN